MKNLTFIVLILKTKKDISGQKYKYLAGTIPIHGPTVNDLKCDRCRFDE